MSILLPPGNSLTVCRKDNLSSIPINLCLLQDKWPKFLNHFLYGNHFKFPHDPSWSPFHALRCVYFSPLKCSERIQPSLFSLTTTKQRLFLQSCLEYRTHVGKNTSKALQSNTTSNANLYGKSYKYWTKWYQGIQTREVFPEELWSNIPCESHREERGKHFVWDKKAYYVTSRHQKADLLNQDRGSFPKIHEDWQTVNGRALSEEMKAKEWKYVHPLPFDR